MQTGPTFVSGFSTNSWVIFRRQKITAWWLAFFKQEHDLRFPTFFVAKAVICWVFLLGMLVEPYWNSHRGRDEFFPPKFFGLHNLVLFFCYACLSLMPFTRQNSRSSSQWFFFGKQLPIEKGERLGADGKSYNIQIPNGKNCWFTMGKKYTKKHLHEFKGILFFDDVSGV